MGDQVKGNADQSWQRLLSVLDDRLQFGLLEHLRRCTSYQLEGRVLIIAPGNADDHRYLVKDTVFQQLQIFAKDIFPIDSVKIADPLI